MIGATTFKARISRRRRGRRTVGVAPSTSAKGGKGTEGAFALGKTTRGIRGRDSMYTCSGLLVNTLLGVSVDK